MVDGQIRPADVTHHNILDAMLRVPREVFFPEHLRELAYAGEHIRLIDDRYALDPRLIAKILNLVNVNRSDLVLDIGGGYGYLANLISHFSEAVVMVEEPTFAKNSEKVLVEQSIDNVMVKAGIFTEGSSDFGPYDAIIIEGGVHFVPDTICNQLKVGGRIVAIFMNGVVGECRLGFKTAKGVNWRFGFNAVAPLLKGFKKEKTFVF